MAVNVAKRPSATTSVALLVEGALELRVLPSLPATNVTYLGAPFLLKKQVHPLLQVHPGQRPGTFDEGGYILLRCDVFIFPLTHCTLWAVLLGVPLLATALAFAAFSAGLGAHLDRMVEGVAPITAGAAL